MLDDDIAGVPHPPPEPGLADSGGWRGQLGILVPIVVLLVAVGVGVALWAAIFADPASFVEAVRGTYDCRIVDAGGTGGPQGTLVVDIGDGTYSVVRDLGPRRDAPRKDDILETEQGTWSIEGGTLHVTPRGGARGALVVGIPESRTGVFTVDAQITGDGAPQTVEHMVLAVSVSDDRRQIAVTMTGISATVWTRSAGSETVSCSKRT